MDTTQCITGVSWNQGTLFDFRNTFYRYGAASTEAKTQVIFQKIKELYEAETNKFNLKNACSEKKLPFWEHPSFTVSPEEKEIIGELHLNIISNFYQKIFKDCSLIFLQELNSKDEINFLEANLHPNFEMVYGKIWDDNMKTFRTDTVILWDKTRFSKLEPLQKETSKGSSLNNFPNFRLLFAVL